MKPTHKIGVGMGAAALTLGGVAGVVSLAQAADPTPTPSSSPSATAGPDAGATQREGHGHGGRHGRGGALGGDQAAALAEKLGLEEAQVTEALRTAREALRPTTKPTDEASRPSAEERRAALAAELATALGIDEGKVPEALPALETERDAERGAALQSRLDQAVTDGKLTRAEADAVKKAVEAGVIGGGPGGRR